MGPGSIEAVVLLYFEGYRMLLDLVQVFCLGGLLMGVLYAAVQYQYARNFFNWQCYVRIAALELLHVAAVFGIIYPLLLHVELSLPWYLVGGSIGLLACAVHVSIFWAAHNWARQVRKERAIQARLTQRVS